MFSLFENKCIFKKSTKESTVYDQLFLCLRDVEEIVIPSYIKTFNEHSFRSCNCLKSLIFEPESSLETIEMWAFYDCFKLLKIVLPASVKKISSYSFDSLYLESIEFLGDGIGFEFGNCCFKDCEKLKKILFPNAIELNFGKYGPFGRIGRKAKLFVRRNIELIGFEDYQNRIRFIEDGFSSDNDMEEENEQEPSSSSWYIIDTVEEGKNNNNNKEIAIANTNEEEEEIAIANTNEEEEEIAIANTNEEEEEEEIAIANTNEEEEEIAIANTNEEEEEIAIANTNEEEEEEEIAIVNTNEEEEETAIANINEEEEETAIANTNEEEEMSSNINENADVDKSKNREQNASKDVTLLFSHIRFLESRLSKYEKVDPFDLEVARKKENQKHITEEKTDKNIFISEEDEEFQEVIEKIGEGASSIAYKIIDTRDNKIMCKKVLKVEEGKTAFIKLQNSIKEF
ncbi:hypothetical protein M9Y10_031604 [Tritrichomonas musculus]|uniref:Protein kinase domain-containing protein n=1 Tax=Tritrichomonas musculus TaxID=1915356 RepID=A0ABR2H169_9EUKA